MYIFDQCFGLIQLENATTIAALRRINIAITLLTDAATVWWCTVAQRRAAAGSLDGFKVALNNYFVPKDHERRAGDSLR